jgi:C4-dicarboxylate transporter DctM subunit
MIGVLLAAFAGLLLLRMPVSFALAIASTAALWAGGVPLTLVVQRMTTAIDSFVLLAVPLFLLAGHLMSSSGISRDIVGLSQSLLGHFRGGIGHANVAASLAMGGMTGSAVADTSSTGVAMIPQMIDRGYPAPYAAAVTAASSMISVVIPPSVPMIIFCVVTGVSVSDLFLAGLIPGLLMAVGMMVATALVARAGDFPREPRQSARARLLALRGSLVALTLPVVIIGSIRLGIATPTEASVVAVIYAALVGRFWYGALPFRALRPLVLEAASTTGVVMLMIAAASLYGLILTRAQVPQAAAAAIGAMTQDPTLVLLMLLVVYLVAGTILDLGANIIILVPVLFPTVTALGIDPVQFGIVTVMGLALGLVTPPVGACLFVASAIARVPMLATARAVGPYVASTLMLIVAIILFPSIAVWLPYAGR